MNVWLIHETFTTRRKGALAAENGIFKNLLLSMGHSMQFLS